MALWKQDTPSQIVLYFWNVQAIKKHFSKVYCVKDWLPWVRFYRNWSRPYSSPWKNFLPVFSWRMKFCRQCPDSENWYLPFKEKEKLPPVIGTLGVMSSALCPNSHSLPFWSLLVCFSVPSALEWALTKLPNNPTVYKGARLNLTRRAREVFKYSRQHLKAPSGKPLLPV